MAVDMLRSCYTTKARLIEGSDHESEIIWYFCEDGAQNLPFTTSVNSLNWVDATERVPTPIGEVAGAPRPWIAGAPPAGVFGKWSCGDQDWFINGGPAGQTFERSPEGPLICCQSKQGTAGVKVQPASSLPFPGHGQVRVAATALTSVSRSFVGTVGTRVEPAS